eukprot:TRINITY_DN49495_c0_g1_i3.p1 TRINITY_DN49495_c0_g1~~TRINITY_DN49495_c0_g1_i3.p1  ORF type:complete len:291 (-),score=61.28 TRINITY_DN49495_c0_g1_i3:121-993(-)
MFIFFFFQAEDGIRDAQESRGLGDVYKRQTQSPPFCDGSHNAMACGPETLVANYWLPFDVVSNTQHTHDSTTLHLRVQESALPALQHCTSVVGPPFHFSARALNQLESRPYTPIRMYPESGDVELLVKRYQGGAVSPVLHALSHGEALELRGPLPGNGFENGVAPSASLALFAAGTGISPILQIAEAVLGSNGTRECSLYCANKSASDVLCADLIGALEEEHKVLSVWHVLEDGGGAVQGRMSSSVLTQTRLRKPGPDDCAVVCGPPLFNKSMVEVLQEYGYSESRITVC